MVVILAFSPHTKQSIRNQTKIFALKISTTLSHQHEMARTIGTKNESRSHSCARSRSCARSLLIMSVNSIAGKLPWQF